MKKLLLILARCVFACHMVIASATSIAMEVPALDVKAYVLMDAVSGNVLAEFNADERLPPASTTKLMTSYLVTEAMAKHQLRGTDQVFISEKAWRTGGSRMFVEPGRRVRAIDLLRGIVIDSGNDASVAMAEHMAGTEMAFAERMNATAGRLGMKNTHFSNATGLPAENHHSSARDMALLAREVILTERADLYALHAEPEFTWNKIKQANRNALLLADPTVDGLKTGRTDAAGWCVVATAVRGGVRLIAVVFGASSDRLRAAQTQRLLGYGFGAFETDMVYQKAKPVGEAKVWQGEAPAVKAGVASDLFVSVAKGSRDQLHVTATFNEPLVAPIARGDAVGQAEVRLGDRLIRTGELVALEDVRPGGLATRLWDGALLYLQGAWTAFPTAVGTVQ